MNQVTVVSPVIAFIFDEQVEPLNFMQYGRPAVMCRCCVVELYNVLVMVLRSQTRHGRGRRWSIDVDCYVDYENRGVMS